MSKKDPFATCPELRKSTLFPIQHANRIISGRFDRLDKQLAGLNATHFFVLLITEHRTISQGVIADALGLNKNSMVKLMDEMEELNLVKRVRNPDNRREFLIESTDKGKHAFHTLFSKQKEIVAEAFFPLHPRDIKKIWDWSIEIIQAHHKAKK